MCGFGENFHSLVEVGNCLMELMSCVPFLSPFMMKVTEELKCELDELKIVSHVVFFFVGEVFLNVRSC